MEESVEETGGRRTRSGRKVTVAMQPTTPVRGRRTRKIIEKVVETETSEEELNNFNEELTYVESGNDFENLIEHIEEGEEPTVNMLPEAEEYVLQEQIVDLIQDPIEEVIYNTDDIAHESEGKINPENQMLNYFADEHSLKEDDQQENIIETVIIENNEVVHEIDNIIDSSIYQDQRNEKNYVMNENNKIENSEIMEGSEQDIEMVEMPLSEKLGNEDEENCSSFPFGTGCSIQQSDNSDNKAEEIVESNAVETVDSSLLASLAGDNANSLPSAGEESLSKENFESNTAEPLEDDITQSENALAEDLANGNETDKTINTVDAEMISEDELQNTPPQKKIIKDGDELSDEEFEITKNNVKGAEEVSDEELPGPKRAELPADAEIISDEELPSNSSFKKETTKRKAENLKDETEEYNPGSPTGEESVEAPEKKVKIDAKEDLKEKKKEKKKLPELDKYWKAVQDDPSDFTGWTYLLQYVDQETDVEAAREAYDAFLSNYPYCYGYWRKYADYEKRKGDKEKCYEVFERGLKAIPLSVDLWMHYLNHVKTNHPDNEEYIRLQFKRAVEACGLEFRSDKLWELYIKWESDAKRYNNVVNIYDQLLTIPTQGYNSHFESFQDLITNHSAALTVAIEEFKKHRHDIREAIKKIKEKKAKESDSPPGNEFLIDDPDELDDHVRNEEEMSSIKDKIISNRRKIHKITVAAVTTRWSFEEGIKRPYFHVKPLERSQLKNWKEYLDFEIEKGDRKRILILFERCLIACALYEEFWLKLIRYLETLMNSNPDDDNLITLIRDAYKRACTIHHKDKPSLHLMWSAFEEVNLNYDMGAEILTKLDKHCPNLLQVAYRRINLERRRGNLIKCAELYEYYIKNAKSKNIAGSLSIKYARFCHKILKNIDKGIEVLRETLQKDSSNTRVALQMIDITLQREIVDEREIVEIMDKFTSRDNIEPDQKVLFAQRKVEFLEDFGSTAKGLQEAQRALQVALQKANEFKKKTENSSPNSKTLTKESKSAAAAASAPAYNNTNSYYSAAGTAQNYYNTGQQQQQQQYQQSYDSYGYNHWQYGAGYSSYGQWSGYGNYY